MDGKVSDIKQTDAVDGAFLLNTFNAQAQEITSVKDMVKQMEARGPAPVTAAGDVAPAAFTRGMMDSMDKIFHESKASIATLENHRAHIDVANAELHKVVNRIDIMGLSVDELTVTVSSGFDPKGASRAFSAAAAGQCASSPWTETACAGPCCAAQPPPPGVPGGDGDDERRAMRRKLVAATSGNGECHCAHLTELAGRVGVLEAWKRTSASGDPWHGSPAGTPAAQVPAVPAAAAPATAAPR